MSEILRSENNRNPYAGRAVRPPLAGVTKWDLLGDDDRAALESQPVGFEGQMVACSTCGADVSTEGRFSRHYVVLDARFWNLGNCPSSER